MKTSQAAVEYLMITAVSLLIIVPAVYVFSTFVEESKEESSFYRVDEIGRTLVENINSISYTGEGSRSKITASLPEEVIEVAIYDSREIVFRMRTSLGESELVYVSESNVTAPGCSPTGKCIILSEGDSGVKEFLVEESDGEVMFKEFIGSAGPVPPTPPPPPPPPPVRHIIGNWTFDEGSGTTAADSSGSGHDATLQNTGAGVWITGVDAGALDLDGADDHVTTPIVQLKTLANFTIAAWFNTDQLDFAHHLLWVGDLNSDGWGNLGGTDQEMHISIGDFDGTTMFPNRLTFFLGRINNDQDQLNITTPFTGAGGWHHAAVVVRDLDISPSATLYLDGDPVGSDTGTVAETDRSAWSVPLQFGKPSDNDRYWDGGLDEVLVWNRSLTDQEISDLNSSYEYDPPLSAALSFDGDEDYVDLGNWNIAGDRLTIEAWIKPTNYANPECGSTDCRVLSKSSGTMTNDHDWMLSTFDIGGGTIVPRFRVKTGGSTETLIGNPGGVIPLNTWTHVAAVYDGSQMRLYTNGLPAGSDTKSGNIDSSANSIWIGGNPPSATARPWEGLIDEVRVWDIDRSQADIQSDMNNELTGSEPGLIGYWNFNEGSGQTAEDSTSSNYDGTLGSSAGNDVNDPQWTSDTFP